MIYKRIAVPVDVYERLQHLRLFAIVHGTNRFPEECRPKSVALGEIIGVGLSALSLVVDRENRGNVRRTDETKIPAELLDAVQACRTATVEAQRVLVEHKKKYGYCSTLYCWSYVEPERVRCALHLKFIAEKTARSREKHPRARRRHGE